MPTRTARASRSAAQSTVNWLTVVGARHNNLRNITVRIPLGRFVCVTGVSGSGKSSLVNDIIREALARDLNGAAHAAPGAHERIEGLKHLDKIIDIDQSPIGRTPRSNPATYIKVFDEIRALYARLPDARVRGYKPGRFSFNVHTGKAGGGRCEACEGNGSNRMEMDFLADVWVTCPVCAGARFNRETLQILYKGKHVAQVLDMDVQQALEHFENVPQVASMLRTLHDVGLDYLKLGQSSTTLSGGEAQRIKLARELVKKSTGRTLYVLDEPTTGLHFADIKRLLAVLYGFVDAGNTVLVIEHNLDVIKTADWVIDLGPEGGAGGGKIVAEGTPEQVARLKRSHTGAALREVLEKRTTGPSVQDDGRPATGVRMPASAPGDPELPHALRRSDSVCVVGARQHNLKNVTVAFPRGKTTVCCGPSGSGKSSFAIDTVYAEGQRRYVESLSAYARQFLSRLSPAKVEHVTGLSPAICIEQKTTSKSPRSTVGTITEIYDYLRVLWTRLGVAYCPKCLVPISTQTSDEIVERILALGDGARVLLLAPVQPAAGETYEQLLRRERENGYRRARVDGALVALDADLGLDHRRDHRVELVVDRVALRRTQASRLADSVEQALSAGNGVLLVSRADDNGASSADSPREQRFSQHFSCAGCGRSYQELTPHHFSFNTRQGWCEACEGLGVQQGASPASIIVRPSRSLLDGAVAGWENVRAGSKLHALIAGLADHIGFDAHRAWNQLTETQRLKVLHGCGEDWITPRGSSELNDLRFRWRGFYPAVSRATSISWQYRKRLEELVTEVACEACSGGRLRPESAAVRLFDRTLPEVCRWPLSQALAWFDGLKLSARQRKIAGELLHEVTARLRFLVDVGLDYVALGRTASTLSGGESQRIQLASQIGTGLTGVLYVLDEPTIGLHPRDNARLILALRKLRDLGNTLLLVEHDREVIESADHVLDFGPGAGAFGGEITAAAAPGELRGTPDSLTGRYLSNREAIPVPTNRRFVGTELRSDLQPDDVAEPGDAEAGDAATGQRHRGRSAAGRARDRLHWLVVHGARQHNLREIDVAFPLGRFVCVTGVSGSGKSTLVTDILYNALAARIHRARVVPGAHERISGVERIDKVINVDQSPLGLTPTSNPATYTGVFDAIRELYAKLPLSKVRGYTANRFSFNRPGGRCEACEGMGQRCIEMHFLPDVWVECENCRGTRYVPETLEVRYREKSIADVLEMRIAAALECFENVPKVRHMLQTLDDVGLGYLTLGQAAPTLSGGEAQRVKLAAELGRPSTGKTLYILDEPTTGLHFDDLRKLLNVLHRLVDLGNTVICIEHNLDVIKTADWLIDLGPEGGAEGGCVVLAGTPEQVAACTHSHTGAALVPVLTAGPRAARAVYRAEERRTLERALTGRIDISAEVQMPWQRDGKAWHTVDHVDFQGAPTQWDPKVLSWLVDTIESLGAFAPTDWNHRSRVEIKAPGNLPWFCHFLTGSKDLLELALRVPAGTFAEGPLARQLAIKALDERRDLPIYGGWSRLAIRAAPDRWQDIRLYLRDFQDVKKSVFRAALKKAAEAYFARVTSAAAAPENEKPWTAQGLQWHLSQKSIRPGRAPQWRPDLLLALVGRFKAMQPDVQVNWTGKTAGQLLVPGEPACAAKIVTNAARGLRVDLRAPRSALTPVEVERLGEEPEIRRGGEWDWILFWVKSLERCDARQLREVWRRCRTAADDEGSGSP